MELKDYYAIMGVKPTDDLKTIKTAYRRLARKYIQMSAKNPMPKPVSKRLLKHGKC
ncbi:curved DNA-binding protein [Salmonella enterica subsp. enterica serovar Sanjuan]|uniref:Curved DNA-binding protein n=1 Tax=Salmonella enterica subsp. enterica serovar Sanjuan TaxID=1160765 RepID=A0A447NWU8_SALET|nr:curved DNA-binding protein [Salmonella enterica subsp. enterica serovar Sanjuan]